MVGFPARHAWWLKGNHQIKGCPIFSQCHIGQCQDPGNCKVWRFITRKRKHLCLGCLEIVRKENLQTQCASQDCAPDQETSNLMKPENNTTTRLLFGIYSKFPKHRFQRKCHDETGSPAVGCFMVPHGASHQRQTCWLVHMVPAWHGWWPWTQVGVRACKGHTTSWR